MLEFPSVITSAVTAARAQGVTLKLATLRDAISYALLNMPYSQAMFSARSGRLDSFPTNPPKFLTEAASRFKLDSQQLESWLTPTAGNAIRQSAYFTVGTSPKLVVDENGEVNGSDECVGQPLFRFVYSGRADTQAWGYCWAEAPSQEEVARVLRAAIAKSGGDVELVCPATVAKEYAECLNALHSNDGVTCRRPDSRKEMARSDVLGFDSQMMWINWRLHDMGEGNPAPQEIIEANQNDVFPIYRENPRDRSLERLHEGYSIAKRICRGRGRVPEVQLALRKSLPHGAPQAVGGVLPQSLDAVDCLITELSENPYWIYDEDRLQIAYMIKAWEITPGSHRELCERAIGAAVFEFCLKFGGMSNDFSQLYLVNTMFGWHHAYGRLMTGWCLREVVEGFASGNDILHMRALKLTLVEVSQGPWLKAFPLQGGLEEHLKSGSGIHDIVFSNHFHSNRGGNREPKWVVDAVIRHASRVLRRDWRLFGWSSQSEKARALSKSPDRWFDYMEPIAFLGEGGSQLDVDLAPWIEQANAALEKWGAGCRISEARLTNPMELLQEDELA